MAATLQYPLEEKRNDSPAAGRTAEERRIALLMMTQHTENLLYGRPNLRMSTRFRMIPWTSPTDARDRYSAAGCGDTVAARGAEEDSRMRRSRPEDPDASNAYFSMRHTHDYLADRGASEMHNAR